MYLRITAVSKTIGGMWRWVCLTRTFHCIQPVYAWDWFPHNLEGAAGGVAFRKSSKVQEGVKVIGSRGPRRIRCTSQIWMLQAVGFGAVVNRDLL